MIKPIPYRIPNLFEEHLTSCSPKKKVYPTKFQTGLFLNFRNKQREFVFEN